MASAKLAFRSVMDTAVKTAGALNSVLDATTKTIGMADAFVSKVALEQQKTYAIGAAVFDNNLIRESAMEQATSDLAATEFRNVSEQHAQLFDQHLSSFEAILKDFRSTN